MNRYGIGCRSLLRKHDWFAEVPGKTAEVLLHAALAKNRAGSVIHQIFCDLFGKRYTEYDHANVQRMQGVIGNLICDTLWKELSERYAEHLFRRYVADDFNTGE